MVVARVLDRKPVQAIGPDAPLRSAADRMLGHRIGSLLVRSAEGEIVGLITEPDIVAAFSRCGADLDRLTVADAMQARVPRCQLEDTLASAMKAMTEQRCRYLTVYDGDELVGLVSIGDVVKRRLAELEHEARMADNFLLWSR